MSLILGKGTLVVCGMSMTPRDFKYDLQSYEISWVKYLVAKDLEIYLFHMYFLHWSWFRTWNLMGKVFGGEGPWNVYHFFLHRSRFRTWKHEILTHSISSTPFMLLIWRPLATCFQILPTKGLVYLLISSEVKNATSIWNLLGLWDGAFEGFLVSHFREWVLSINIGRHLITDITWHQKWREACTAF